MAVRPYRKRYILFEIISNQEIDEKKVEKTIFQSTNKLLGSYGTSKSKLRFMPQFWRKKQGVLSVEHSHVPKIKTALAMVSTIGNQKIILYSKKVYGTLKKIKKIYGG